MIQHPKKQRSPEPQAAETAAAVLGWIAGEPDILSRFLALSGLDPQNLRHIATDPGFLGGVLDFIMSHEPDLMRFCETSGMKPEDVAAAWRKLSGPGLDSGEY